MGMYTECYICTELKELAPVTLNVLKFMFGWPVVSLQTPDHEFFSKPRWQAIGRGSSYYHVPQAQRHFFEDQGCYYLVSRSDLKNYDGEIEAFFDWILPYCKKSPGEFIGYFRYEEDDLPTLVVKKP